MRITGGAYSGRVLRVPKNLALRPTQDYVRQALFNILGDAVEGSRVLDLFAGTGAWGIEALSRGAAAVDFVEKGVPEVKSIQKSLEQLDWAELASKTRIIRKEALAALAQLDQQERRYEFVFLDPPYGEDWPRKTLNDLSRYAIVSPGGWVVVEQAKRDPLPDPDLGEKGLFSLRRKQLYGDTVLLFYQQ